jgi:hypothetical protein
MGPGLPAWNAAGLQHLPGKRAKVGAAPDIRHLLNPVVIAS